MDINEVGKKIDKLREDIILLISAFEKQVDNRAFIQGITLVHSESVRTSEKSTTGIKIDVSLQ